MTWLRGAKTNTYLLAHFPSSAFENDSVPLLIHSCQPRFTHKINIFEWTTLQGVNLVQLIHENCFIKANITDNNNPSTPPEAAVLQSFLRPDCYFYSCCNFFCIIPSKKNKKKTKKIVKNCKDDGQHISRFKNHHWFGNTCMTCTTDK